MLNSNQKNSHFIKSLYIVIYTGEPLRLLYQQLQENNPMDLKILKCSTMPIQRYFNLILYTNNTLQIVKRDFQISTDRWMYYPIFWGKKIPTNTNKWGAQKLIHINVPLYVLQQGRRKINTQEKQEITTACCHPSAFLTFTVSTILLLFCSLQTLLHWPVFRLIVNCNKQQLNPFMWPKQAPVFSKQLRWAFSVFRSETGKQKLRPLFKSC